MICGFTRIWELQRQGLLDLQIYEYAQKKKSIIVVHVCLLVVFMDGEKGMVHFLTFRSSFASLSE
jgi:hypothetical protein